MSEILKFYMGRIESCPNYGFVSGHDILKTVTRCAFYDSSLTLDEFNTIMMMAEKCHIKLMEMNYNEGWN